MGKLEHTIGLVRRNVHTTAGLAAVELELRSKLATLEGRVSAVETKLKSSAAVKRLRLTPWLLPRQYREEILS